MTDLTWALSSCVLILAVIAIRAAFGKRMRPGLRYALWGLVLLRLLVPFEVGSSRWSVADALQKASVPDVSETVVAWRSITISPDLAIAEPDSSLPAEEQRAQYEINKAEWETDVAKARTVDATPVTVADVLNWVWYMGLAVTAALFLASNLRFYAQLRRRRRPLDADCPLRVYAVEALSSSCLFGNAIYVAAETAADGTRLRHVLAHELSHHRHGDHVWTLLRCAALSLHWYNPLVWWAAALSRQDSELCADAGALRYLGEDERERYGATLIELSARRAARASLLCTATTMTNGKRSLRERVTMIARRPRMTAAVVIAVVTLAAVAAGCAFAGATARTAPMTEEDAPPVSEREIDLPDEAGAVETLRVTDSYEVAARRTGGDGWSVAIPPEGWTREGDAWTSDAGSTLGVREASREEASAERPQLAAGQAERFVEAPDGRIWLVRTQYDPSIALRSDVTGLEPAVLEAMAASFRATGTAAPLSADELAAWTEALRTTVQGAYGAWSSTLVSCFFTSHYGTPRDIDLPEFLAYCFPLSEAVEDEAEFEAVNARAEFRHTDEDGTVRAATLAEMPVPVRRYRAAAVDAALTRYAGVTLDDMSTDWRNDGRMIYLPEYDAFYNFTSDYGPGMFEPERGERLGNVVRLYDDRSVLQVSGTPDDFRILSFTERSDAGQAY